MTYRFFVVGTDTNIGKTYISVGLLKAFNQLKYSTLALKPIASDCYLQDGKLVNEEVLALQQAASIYLDYAKINPFAFATPISPNIAAQQLQQVLAVDDIVSKMQPSLNHPADVQLIEGVGGWDVPLSNTEKMSDLVKMLNVPVLLVVGIKLGCINHSLLTAQAIKNSGVKFIGWVANCLEPTTLVRNEIIATLQYWLEAPCLGIVNYKQQVAESMDVSKILDAL